jgi:integrase/recombinase XerD
MTEYLLDTTTLTSWKRYLRAQAKSEHTTKGYGEGIHAIIRWADRQGVPPTLTKANTEAYLDDELTAGMSAKTMSGRLTALKQIGEWLVREGEIDSNPVAAVRQPKIPKKVVEPLSDDELKALLAACKGKDKAAFTSRRDEAIVRLLLETGMRAGELIALRVDDVDLDAGQAIIRKGKGGKGRVVAFGAQAVAAIDRYLRARRTHKLASAPALWLGGDNWRTFSYAGLHHTLRARAAEAGIVNFHPHRMRHTAATRWLRAGGSEQGLMALSGWSSRSMLDRYTAATASERAAAEARRLGLGDI